MGMTYCCKKDLQLETDKKEIFCTCTNDEKIPSDSRYSKYNEDKNSKKNKMQLSFNSLSPNKTENDPSMPLTIRHYNKKENAAFLIQFNFKKYQLNKKIKNMKTQYQNETYIFLNDLFNQFNKFGKIPPINDFSINGWKNFYLEDDEFFNWDKGRRILSNQIKILNSENISNILIYKGEVNYKNEKHGIGECTTSAFFRKGTWRNDKFTGWCIESRRNGEIFEGKFVNGLINGKGKYTNNKGYKYIGDFINSERNGKGILTTKNFIYNGGFVKNRMEGKGKIEYLNEGHKYEGDFENNEINGNGKFIWKNGDVYEGKMANGRMDGYGKYTYKNGIIYEGDYVEGIKQGTGKLIYPDGKIYKGEFKNGFPSGQGELIKGEDKEKIEVNNGIISSLEINI